MAKIKLTKSDFSLLSHALDILETDYQEEPYHFIPFRQRMRKKIERLRLKLLKLQKGDSK